MQQDDGIKHLIMRVRRRWRTLRAFRALTRTALAVAIVVAVALSSVLFMAGAPGVLAAIAIGALLAVAVVIALGVWPLRTAPTDRQVARYIEERDPALDDRLVSAVDVADRSAQPNAVPTALTGPMLADASRRASDVDIDAIVPHRTLRRAAMWATAAAAAVAVILFVGRNQARQAKDAASLMLFPDRVTLDVKPGSTRIKAGTPLSIRARLIGNRAPVIAQLQIADGDRWRASEMSGDGQGLFQYTTDAVNASFKYRIVAGAVTSPTYDVMVAHAPRVMRIDVDYDYPDGLNLKPRTEQDGGDIYAPAGTDVRVHVFTDRPASNGQMAFGDGKSIALMADKPTEFSASLKVVADNSYRIALDGPEGVSNPGETEYFVRTLEDRPPEVRILKPATDRSVMRLEEVDIDAQAEDDYGVERLDLVYAVRGAGEKTVPLAIPKNSTTVNGHHTLYLEDLDVKPGDFVSYYVRARDLTRGTRPNEARSDIFFLEVKPFEQEFALAQSSSMAGGGATGNIDDLVTAQKEIVVATWKLDRRAQNAKGAKSDQDIRSVGRAEAELKTRVEQTSSSFRESTMRNPRQRPAPGRGQSPRAGETMPEEDDMTAAAAAMAKAAASLDDLKTAPAIPPEMEALNHLLNAQAAVKKREVTRQQAGSGAGNNNRNYDVSALFDKELQKQQQTNYETKSSSEQRDDAKQSALDKIRDLARRQDELLKKQADLARNRAQMSEEELKRELEKLTREQSDLRQRAEDLARQMAGGQQNQSGQQQNQQNQQGSKSGQQNQQGQQAKSGQQGQGGQESQQGQAGGQQQSQSNQGGASGDAGKRMRDVSEEMRNATSDLRRQDPRQATASAQRALERLRALERQMQSAAPDERRRALGEMQLEARQLADAQRQISSELSKTGQGDASKDALRRLAGEQERLAERARRLQDGLKQQAAGKDDKGADPRDGGRGSDGAANDGARSRGAAADAARELERQRLADRMQQSADAVHAIAERGAGAQRGNTAQGPTPGDTREQANAQDAMARQLDKVADTLASASGAKDAEARKLSDQLSRVQDQRDRLNALGREIDKAAGRQNGATGSQSASSQKAAGQSGKPGEGQQGGGGGSGTDLAKLREQYMRQLQETRDLLDQLAREDQTYTQGGAGTTFVGRGMTLSAPGTEAFKQDFAKWDDLKRQATQALDAAASSISKKLQAKQAHDRLAAGTDDKPPAEYKNQVDSYFKAIAAKKKP